MKKLGLIGGMTPESTLTYYQTLNRLAKDRLGGQTSADILLWSFNFSEINDYLMSGDWDGATTRLIEAARTLEQGGAEIILICTNTMHKIYDAVQASVSMPCLHIADPTGQAVKEAGCKRPLLLATAFTMEQNFYKDRLAGKFGLDPIVPNAADRAEVHRIISDELWNGEINPASKARYLDIAGKAIDEGADAIIFGCTEIGLLIQPKDFSVPCFDTALLHSAAAIDLVLA